MKENTVQMPTVPRVYVYTLPMSHLRTAELLRRNIAALLTARGLTQVDLAFSLGHGKSWINKFLNDARGLQLKDLGPIADVLGVQTYQLFQPGTSTLTERRTGLDRRSGRERRVGHAHRMMEGTRAELDRVSPGGKGQLRAAAKSLYRERLERITQRYERELSALISEFESGRQTSTARKPVAKTRKGRRAGRRPDTPTPKTA